MSNDRVVTNALTLCLLLAAFILPWSTSQLPAAEPLKPAEIRSAQTRIQAAMKARNLSNFTKEVKQITSQRNPNGAQVLITLNLEDLPEATYLHTLTDALAALVADGGAESMIELFRASMAKGRDDWRQRVLIVQAFAAAGGKEARTLLVEAAGDAHAKVRLATAVSLAQAKLSDADVVAVGTALLESSEKAKDVGTPHRLARRALTRRTGFDHPDAAEWRRFWSEAGENFTQDKRGEATDLEMAQSGDPQYYSDPLISRRLLFIVDTSKSMEGIDIEGWPDVPQDKQAIGNRRSADGFGWVLSPEQGKWFLKNPEARRITRAKGELLRMLDKLPEHAQFNIVTFDTKLSSWSKSLVPASAGNVKSAIRFVESLKADGHTRADLALAEIYKSNSEADTVYFLSDGTPSMDGKRHMPIAPLIQMVSRANMFQQIVIHTYGIGEDGQEFLEQLAKETGGHHRKVVGPPQK